MKALKVFFIIELKGGMANNDNDISLINVVNAYDTYYIALQKDLTDVDLGVNQEPCYSPLTEVDAQRNPFFWRTLHLPRFNIFLDIFIRKKQPVLNGALEIWKEIARAYNSLRVNHTNMAPFMNHILHTLTHQFFVIMDDETYVNGELGYQLSDINYVAKLWRMGLLRGYKECLLEGYEDQAPFKTWTMIAGGLRSLPIWSAMALQYYYYERKFNMSYDDFTLQDAYRRLRDESEDEDFDDSRVDEFIDTTNDFALTHRILCAAVLPQNVLFYEEAG